MTRYKLFWEIDFDDKINLYFQTEHFCWEIVNFYQFFRFIYFKFISDPGLPDSDDYFRIQILLKVRIRPDPDPQHWCHSTCRQTVREGSSCLNPAVIRASGTKKESYLPGTWLPDGKLGLRELPEDVSIVRYRHLYFYRLSAIRCTVHE